MWYVIFLFSTVFHEASHAFAAMKLGDKTAYHGGQVSLDPIPHIRQEPFGIIFVPLCTFIMSGWMIGWASTPYDYHWAQRYPRRSALMSLAGPLANLFLFIISGLLIRLGFYLDLLYAPDSVTFSQVTAATHGGALSPIAVILSIFFALNLILFLFNLLPLPPLDGSGIIPFFLENETARKYMDFVSNPGMMFFGILIAWNAFDYIFDPIHLVFLNMLYPGISYS